MRPLVPPGEGRSLPMVLGPLTLLALLVGIFTPGLGLCQEAAGLFSAGRAETSYSSSPDSEEVPDEEMPPSDPKEWLEVATTYLTSETSSLFVFRDGGGALDAFASTFGQSSSRLPLLQFDDSRRLVMHLREGRADEFLEFMAKVRGLGRRHLSGPGILALNNHRGTFVAMMQCSRPFSLVAEMERRAGRTFTWLGRSSPGTAGLRVSIPLGEPDPGGELAPLVDELDLVSGEGVLAASNSGAELFRLRRAIAGQRFLSQSPPFDESVFRARLLEEYTGEEDVFFGLDLESGIREASASSTAFRRGTSLLGFGDLGLVFGRLNSSGESVVAAVDIPMNPSGGGLASVAGSSRDHPLMGELPSTCGLGLCVDVESMQALYDLWSACLLEFEYRRENTQLSRAEERLNRSVGFSVRDSLLPLLGREVAIGVSPSMEGLQWLIVLETAEGRLVDEMITSAISRRVASVEEQSYEGVRYRSAKIERLPDDLFIFWRYDEGVFVAGTGKEVFESQMALKLGTERSLLDHSGCRDYLERQEMASSVFVCADGVFLQGLAVSVLSGGLVNPAWWWRSWSSGSENMVLASIGPQEGKTHLRAVIQASPDRLLTMVKRVLDEPPRAKRAYADRMTRTRLALEKLRDLIRAYHARNGELPDSLSDLGRLAFDPFSPGERYSLGYAKLANGGFRIWSMGPDGRNDSGLLEYSQSNGLKSRGDLILEERNP